MVNKQTINRKEHVEVKFEIELESIELDLWSWLRSGLSSLVFEPPEKELPPALGLRYSSD